MALVAEIVCEGTGIPEPKTGYCLAVIDHFMYTWGGHTQQLVEDPEVGAYPVEESLPNTDDNFIDVYDIHNKVWHQYATSGDVPDLGNGSTMVAYGHDLYLFGGWNEGVFSSELYKFDTNTNTWELIVLADDQVKPSPRYRTEAVLYNHQICIYGGTGSPIENIQPGARYVELKQYSHNYGYGWNNEMYLFDIKKRCWKVPQLSGDNRPPPCTGFTFNMIDTHRALMFGGEQEAGRVSNVYIFDFLTNQWSEAYVPQHAEQPWPCGRTLHTATCLVDPKCIPCENDENFTQHLFVLWGKGGDNKHCKDVWILNVNTMEWSQVQVALKPRMWHMSCAYHIEGARTDAVLFGGNIQRQSNAEKHVQRGLTMFSFGVLTLKELCLKSVGQHHSSLISQLESAPVVLRTMLSNHMKHDHSYTSKTQ